VGRAERGKYEVERTSFMMVVVVVVSVWAAG
jgi:hypothetical protein